MKHESSKLNEPYYQWCIGFSKDAYTIFHWMKQSGLTLFWQQQVGKATHTYAQGKQCAAAKWYHRTSTAFKELDDANVIEYIGMMGKKKVYTITHLGSRVELLPEKEIK
jgi:hypothetical protein